MTDRHVYVVEDEEAIRRSAQLMLKLMGYTALTFEHGGAFLEEAEELAQGCVLLDIRMPHIDGLEVQKRLRAANSPHSVVVMSGHGDVGVAIPAIANGAVAFIEKPFAKATLERALQVAFARVDDPGEYDRFRHEAVEAIAGLEPIARKVLAMIARGHGNDKIAAELDFAPGAVDLVRTQIFEQLRIASLNEALPLAFAAGLIEPVA